MEQTVSQSPLPITVPAVLTAQRLNGRRKRMAQAVFCCLGLLFLFFHRGDFSGPNPSDHFFADVLVIFNLFLFAFWRDDAPTSVGYRVKSSWYGLKHDVTLVTEKLLPISLTLPPDEITAIMSETWRGFPAWRVEYLIRGKGRTQTAYIVYEPSNQERVENELLPVLRKHLRSGPV